MAAGHKTTFTALQPPKKKPTLLSEHWFLRDSGGQLLALATQIFFHAGGSDKIHIIGLRMLDYITLNTGNR